MKLFGGVALFATVAQSQNFDDILQLAQNTECTGSESYSDSTTSCDSNAMTLSIPKCAFENARLNSPGSSYIAGPSLTTQITTEDGAVNSCVAVENGANWEYTVSANLEDCGGVRTTNSTHVIYQNAAQLTDGKQNSFISRIRTMLVDFECSFPIKIQLAATEIVSPTITSYEVSMPGDGGAFVVAMAIYETSAFETVAGADYQIEVPEPIHIQISLDLTTEFHVTMDSCWATATNNPDDVVRFEFITAGCGDATELSDGTLVVYENGASTTSSFAIDAFTFNAASESQTEVYFHCEAIMCDKDHETCAPSCGGRRKRRSTAFLSNHIVTSVGPIKIIPENSSLH